MDDVTPPDFSQDTLPGVAVMAAALLAGKKARDAARATHQKAVGTAPGILAEAATPLAELAEFTRKQVDDLTAFAASKGVTSKVVGGATGPWVRAGARQFPPGLGTYVARIAGPVIGALLAQKLMEARPNHGEEKKAAPTPGKEVQSPGILRSGASAAWRMGTSTPKPKTIQPNSSPTARAKDTPTAKPPSKTSFYSDIIQSMNNPQRGFRQAKPG